MATKRVSPDPPPEALPDGESNRYLAKFKTSLCKRWSATRTEPLYEIFDLAAFLWALERPHEALAIAAAVATAIPEPPPLAGGRTNYNLWCPATYSHALIVHLGITKSANQATASRAALLRDAGIARDNPAYIAEKVTEARQLAAAPASQDSIKWECMELSRAIGSLVLYSELAKAGDALFKPHLKDATAALPQLLSKLQARLQSGK